MSPQKRSVSTHSIQRSIARLAVGASREMSLREQRNAASRMGEREEQFQIKCSGRASDYPAWQEATLYFEQTFSAATGNRMSLLQRPQVSIGCEVEQAVSEAPPVDFQGNALASGLIFNAYVSQWLRDEAGNFRGAKVMISAMSPGDNVRFTGYVHVTFQGFGALTEPADTGD